MTDFVHSVVFMLTLLNPLLMIVYLTDVIKTLSFECHGCDRGHHDGPGDLNQCHSYP